MRAAIHDRLARAALVFFSGLLCLLVLAAPALALLRHGRMAALAYLFFAPVCHQMPERSFEFFGYPWAVCQRCAGIYLGIFLAATMHGAIPRRLVSLSARRSWVCAASAPMLLDVGLSFTGLWSSTTPSRLCTGLIFGIMLSSLLAPALSEFLFEAPWKASRNHATELQGGAS